MLDLDERAVWDELKTIPDPEIPSINLVDLGVIYQVEVSDKIRVTMLPTFVGCPALEMMQREIKGKLAPFGPVEVRVVFDEPWTTERMTPAGREMLREGGFAPPPEGDFLDTRGMTELTMAPERVACPYCASTKTRMDSPFGPTPCRQIYYCEHCKQPFERFKPV